MLRTFRDVEKALRDLEDKIEKGSNSVSDSGSINRPQLERLIGLSEEKIRSIATFAFGSAMNNDLRLSEDGHLIYHDLEHYFNKSAYFKQNIVVNAYIGLPDYVIYQPTSTYEFRISELITGTFYPRLKFICPDRSSLKDRGDLTLYGDVTPDVDDSYNLGSSSKNWNALHLKDFLIGSAAIIPTTDIVTSIGASNKRILHSYLYDIRVGEQIISEPNNTAYLGLSSYRFKELWLTDWAMTSSYILPTANGVQDIAHASYRIRRLYTKYIDLLNSIELTVDNSVNIGSSSYKLNILHTHDISLGTNQTASRILKTDANKNVRTVGNAGYSGARSVILSANNVVLYYKDWAGNNQTQIVLVSLNAYDLNFDEGINY